MRNKVFKIQLCKLEIPADGKIEVVECKGTY